LDIPPERITGFVLVDSIIAGDTELVKSVFLHMAMPVGTLAFVYGAPIFKMLRGRMEEALASDYTLYGIMLGLPRRTTFLRALRSAAGPTLVMTGVVSGFLLGGAVLVESVFNLNGIGQYAIKAIATADYAPLQSFVLVSAIVTATIYLLVDIAMLFVDPRLAGDR
ncbi:MAG: ABC transporter permease, partial [Mesorhizobium sp.]